MEGNTAIQIIVAKPNSPRTYGYYLNGSLTDPHIMTLDDFYLFVAEKLRPPATVEVAKLIQSLSPFLVNIPENRVRRLSMDKREFDKELVMEFKSVNYNEIIDQLEARKEKSIQEQHPLNRMLSQWKQEGGFQQQEKWENFLKGLDSFL